MLIAAPTFIVFLLLVSYVIGDPVHRMKQSNRMTAAG